MDEKYLDILQKLKVLTKETLSAQYESVEGFVEDSIHRANRCSIQGAISEVVFAEMSASRLRQDAQRQFEDGHITPEALVQITDLSTELVLRELPFVLSIAITEVCECKDNAPASFTSGMKLAKFRGLPVKIAK